MIFSFKDAYRQAVEFLSDGQNTVMYDDQGNPNIMVCIPKYTLDMIKFGKGDTHPAFICEGNEVNEFWISKYQNTIGNGGVPCSMPDADPAIVTPQVIHDSCLKKGRGWHQMTAPEYGAIIMLAAYRGHNMGGRYYDIGYNTTKAVGDAASACYSERASSMDRCASIQKSGTGPESQAYDGIHGVYDLVGNSWEFTDGVRIQESGGQIEFFGQTDYGTFGNDFLSHTYHKSPWAIDIEGEKMYIDDADGDELHLKYKTPQYRIINFEDICYPNGDTHGALETTYLQAIGLLPVTSEKRNANANRPEYKHGYQYTGSGRENKWWGMIGVQSGEWQCMLRGGRGDSDTYTEQIGVWSVNVSAHFDSKFIVSPRAVYIDI